MFKYSPENIYFSPSKPKPVNGRIRATFYPTYDNWNDFGSKTFYSCLIENEKRHEYIDYLTSAFFEGDLGDYEIVNSFNGPKKVQNISQNFISQVLGRDYFEKLSSFCGRYEAINILKHINDASILNAISPNHPALTLFNDRTVQESVFRNTDNYKAFHNGPGIIMGDFVETPKEIKTNFQLNGFASEHRVKINLSHDDIFSSHISVLIGENGTGKSQTMRNVIYNMMGEDDLGFNRVILLSNTTNDESVYPRGFTEGDLRNLFYRYSNLSIDDDHTDTQFLAQIIRDQYSTVNGLKVFVFEKMAKEIAPFTNILIPMQEGSPYIRMQRATKEPNYASLEQFKSLNGEQNEIDFVRYIDTSRPLIYEYKGKKIGFSTGQNFFFKILMRIMSYIEKGSLVLFDEPETFLHPNLESKLVRLLDKICEETESHCIISTHSVFITREVPTSHVCILKRDHDGHPQCISPQIQTFGANLDEISNYVFGDLDIDKRYEEKLDQMYERHRDIDTFLDENEVLLNFESVMYLSNRD